MDFTQINKGTAANNGTGTTARAAADIINQNFKILFDRIIELNGHKFLLIKAGGNAGDGLEQNDVAALGFWEGVEFWPFAQYKGGDPLNKNNWDVRLSV